jgi:hypothetical protein
MTLGTEQLGEEEVNEIFEKHWNEKANREESFNIALGLVRDRYDQESLEWQIENQSSG